MSERNSLSEDQPGKRSGEVENDKQVQSVNELNKSNDSIRSSPNPTSSPGITNVTQQQSYQKIEEPHSTKSSHESVRFVDSPKQSIDSKILANNQSGFVESRHSYTDGERIKDTTFHDSPHQSDECVVVKPDSTIYNKSPQQSVESNVLVDSKSYSTGSHHAYSEKERIGDIASDDIATILDENIEDQPDKKISNVSPKHSVESKVLANSQSSLPEHQPMEKIQSHESVGKVTSNVEEGIATPTSQSGVPEHQPSEQTGSYDFVVKVADSLEEGIHSSKVASFSPQQSVEFKAAVTSQTGLPEQQPLEQTEPHDSVVNVASSTEEGLPSAKVASFSPSQSGEFETAIKSQGNFADIHQIDIDHENVQETASRGTNEKSIENFEEITIDIKNVSDTPMQTLDAQQSLADEAMKTTALQEPAGISTSPVGEKQGYLSPDEATVDPKNKSMSPSPVEQLLGLKSGQLIVDKVPSSVMTPPKLELRKSSLPSVSPEKVTSPTFGQLYSPLISPHIDKPASKTSNVGKMGTQKQYQDSMSVPILGKSLLNQSGSKSVPNNVRVPDAPLLFGVGADPEKPPSVYTYATSTYSVATTSALSLSWCFGWNRNIPVHNLCDETNNRILYTCAHVAVIYNFVTNTQTLLQGHANTITGLCLSIDKKWLATGDMGDNSSVIIWDTHTTVPVQTIFEPGEKGVAALALTRNARYLATLSAGHIQMLAIWDWTISGNTPLCSAELSPEYGLQTEILFNPENEHEIVSNSESQVIFYFWDNASINYFAPPLTDYNFMKPVGKFSQSLFFQSSTRALTATSIGNLVVWSENTISKDSNSSIADKKALKIIKVMDSAIRVLTYTGRFIALGLANGLVKFYDQELKLMNWYSEFEFGPILSLSFDNDSHFTDKAGGHSKYPFDATIERPPFVVRNFIVSTGTSVIAHITTNGSVAKVILQEHDAEVRGLAAHPSRPVLSIGSYASLLKCWNYKSKEIVVSRRFGQSVKISCLKYNTNGSILAMGTSDGHLYLLDSVTLENHHSEPYHFARDVITHIQFNHDSKYLATADAECTMSLFKRTDAVYASEYVYLARYKAHYKPICDVLFGKQLDSESSRLLSLGEDRLLVEYDLDNSSVGELRILSTDRIEQSSLPLSMVWHPPIIKEHFILISNDQFKFKLYNATTKMCRKTVLSPTYGSPIVRMMLIPRDRSNHNKYYIAYSTQSKIGVHITPLDGNPNNSMSVIAHPQGVSNIACSFDGKYLFSAGGPDECVHMWNVNTPALEAQKLLGGEDLIPFYGLLDGGREGQMFADMEDYFYYAMIRSQGVNSNTKRDTSTTIPLYQVPNVMRAMGFYPTEQEIENMMNEVKFSEYVETGKFIDEVDLRTFIKLYVNHRPAFGLPLKDLFDAFETLGYESDIGTVIERSDLLEMLQSKGEHMTVFELAEYLTTLLGYNAEGGTSEGHQYDPTYAGNIIDEHLPYQVTADMFSQEVLGFSALEKLDEQ